MKSISVALSLALAGLSTAQFNGLPKCAQSCAEDYLNSSAGNCGLDPKCICSNNGFISGVACCLVGACDKDGQSSVVNFASSLCAAYHVTVPATVSCTSTSGAPASSSSSGGSGSGSTGPSSAPATTTTGANASGTGNVASTSGPTESGNFAARQTKAAGIVGGLAVAVALL